MFPLLIPLLSIGTSLIGQLTGHSSDDKASMIGTIQKLFESGDKDQLEAEVQRLAILAKADQTQADTTKLSIEQGGGKWRDQLATLGVGTLGLDWFIVSTLNVVSVWINGIFGTTIAAIPHMDVTQALTVVGSLAGIQTLSSLSQNRQM